MGKIASPFSTCFVCCKKVKLGLEAEVDKKRKLICEQFLVLMSRYLNLNRADDLHYGSEKTLDFKPGPRKKKNATRKRGKLFSCDHCLPLIESVCAIYKDWSVLQVKLNASIKLMANLMQDRPTSMTVADDFEDAIDFRIRFIKQALNKLNTKDFPHLALKRLSTDSLPAYAKNFCDVVSKQENVASATTTAVTSGTICKVEPELVQEQDNEVAVDLDDADWQPNSDVEMDHLENDDDEDYYNEGDHNEIDTPRSKSKELKVSQKRKITKKKIGETTDRENDDDDDDEAKHNDEKIDRDVKANNPKTSLKMNKSIPSDNKISKKLKRKSKCHKCEICGKVLSKKIKLLQHMNTHTNSKPLKCRFCPRGFNGDGTRRYHEIKCDNNPKVGSLYKCGICDKTFSHYPTCYTHQKVHHEGQKPRVIKLDKLENKNSDLGMDVAGSKDNVADDLNKPETETEKVPIPHSSKEMLLEDDNATFKDATSLNCPDEDSDSGSADVWQPSDRDNDEDDDGGKIDKDVESNNPKGSSKKANQNIPSDNKISKTLKPKSKRHKCEICSKVFPRNTDLVEHTKSHSNFEVFLDQFKTQLGETAQRSNSIPASVNPKRCLKTYKCYQCDDTIFTSWPVLREHVKKVHGGKRLFPCKLCNQTFSGLETLRSHNQRRHPTERGPFPCQFCGKTFLLKYYLKNHEVRNCKSNPARSNPPGGLEQFVCEICGKVYNVKSSLRTHKQTVHSKNSNSNPNDTAYSFPCQFCGREYTLRHKREYHEGMLCKLNPANAGRYICEKCGKYLPNRAAFKNHMYNHRLEEGPGYPCSVCGKRFQLSDRRNDHERSHKEPAIECGYCGEKFIWKSSCRSHIKSKHKGQTLVGRVVNLLKKKKKSLPLTTSLPVPVVATVTETPTVETPPVLATENKTESD